MATHINNRKYLSATSVGLMTAAAVVTSLRGLPLLAKEEMTMFAYLAFTLIFYLVPASLVSAELGGAFADKKGGVYAWVGEAFGTRWGFLAIWLQWIQNVVWFPVGLTFGAAALAYTVGRPELAENGAFVGVFCIVVYWIATAIVLRGVEVFARIANWSFILGTIVPGLVLLGLLAYWIVSGHPLAWQHLTDPAVSEAGQARFWPAIHGFGTIAFLAGIILLFAGVEVQAVHINEMRRPSREYPIAIAIGAVLALVIFALGAIPIAGILPHEKISLQSGVFDTFSAVITDIWHMGWLVQVFSLLVGLGAVSGVFAWLGSPSKGLLATASDGDLPPVLQTVNDKGMPTHILIVQGAIVTVMSALYFLIKDVSVVFFLLSAMTIALYLIAYMFMYAAAIKLRYAKPQLARPFALPGGILGMWLIAGIGFAGVLFSFLVAFFPPDQLPVGSPALYVGLVIGGTVLFCAIPLLMHRLLRQRPWSQGSRLRRTESLTMAPCQVDGALLVMPNVGCRTDPTARGGEPEHLQTNEANIMKTDLQLQQDVSAELKWEPSVQAAQIGVEVKNGVVTLSGEVATFTEKWRAQRAAQRVAGVHALTMDLTVNLFGLGKRTDVDVARSAESALLWSTSVPDDAIKISVEGGWVTLSGTVGWYFQKQAAFDAVRDLSGVTGVSNDIAINPKASASAVQGDIEEALKRSAIEDAKEIQVSINGSAVILTGTIHSWAERETAVTSAWASPGVRSVVDDMTLAY